MIAEKSEMIFGVRAVIEAIQAGKEIDKILVKRDIQSDLSKELFAVPGSLLNPLYDGTNQLIQDGAYPLLRPRDVLVHFGIEEKTKGRQKKAKPKLTPIEQQIYDCLGRETKSTNQLFSQTKIPMVQLKALLTKMEMEGVITSVSAGVYCTK